MKALSNDETSQARDCLNRTARIRALNDTFRRTFTGGRVMLTAGFNALPDEVKREALARIRMFDTFEPGNDLYREHDFVSIEIDGQTIFAKTDYYDLAMKYGSEDPSDPDQTTRVMTIMLASEY